MKDHPKMKEEPTEFPIPASRRKRMSHQVRTDLCFKAKGIAFRSDALASDIEAFLAQALADDAHAKKHPLFDLACQLRSIGATVTFTP